MEHLAGMIILGVIAAIGYGAYYGSAPQKMKRALRKLPLIPIADAQDGQLVKVMGKVAYATEPLEAPLSRRTCAYFQAKVIRDDKSHEILIDETQHVETLWVEDESGRALVELRLADVVLSMDAKSTSGILDDPDEREQAFLEAHDQPASGWVFNKSLIYREGVLEAGEEIVVFGLCKMEIDPDPPPGGEHGYRESPMRTRIVAPDDGLLLISDDAGVLHAASRK